MDGYEDLRSDALLLISSSSDFHLSFEHTNLFIVVCSYALCVCCGLFFIFYTLFSSMYYLFLSLISRSINMKGNTSHHCFAVKRKAISS